MAQREIKRVLAYSTMSQVGYMFVAVGVGSVSAAMFHLLTHAFFKALLFMAAGCLINLAGHENDIYQMGGMKQRSKTVFWMFLAGLLCLAGAPLTGGFFSKDLILATAFARGVSFHLGIYAGAVLTAALTSFYSFRLAYLVFAGDFRGDELPHEVPGLMTWPLLPLALLGLFGGLLNLPHLFGGQSWLSGWLVSEADVLHLAAESEYLLIGMAVGVFALGWLAAYLRYRRFEPRGEGPFSRFLLDGWRFDGLFDTLLVRPFNMIGRFLWQGGEVGVVNGLLEGVARTCLAWGRGVRLLTNGRIGFYLQGFVWGLLLIVGWFLLRVATW
jgi:NADH-quinone oxidoreductase subunit L